MASWTINRGALILLMGLFALIVLILILPDIDLPDTAFHRGTAPVVEHSQASSAPSLLTVRILARLFVAHEATALQGEHSFSSHQTLQSLPILHQSLRC